MSMHEIEIHQVEELIRKVNLSSMFALPYFVNSFAQKRPFKFLYIQTEHNEFLTHIIIDSFRLKSLRIFKRALSYSPPQPLKKTKNISQDIYLCLKQLENYAYNILGCKSISIFQYPHDPPLLDGLVSTNNWRINKHHRQDIYLQTSENLHNIYFNMEKRHRYALRKATGLNDEAVIEITPTRLIDIGFDFKVGEDRTSIKQFYKLLMITFKKMQRRFGYGRMKRITKPFKFKNYVRSTEILLSKGLCKIFLIYKEKSPLCGAILHLSNDFLSTKKAHWSAGASTKKAKQLGLPLLLQWMIIKWLAQNSYEKYFLGGLDSEHYNEGPTLFKRGFKGKIVNGIYATHEKNILKIIRAIKRNLNTQIPIMKQIISFFI